MGMKEVDPSGEDLGGWKEEQRRDGRASFYFCTFDVYRYESTQRQHPDSTAQYCAVECHIHFKIE